MNKKLFLASLVSVGVIFANNLDGTNITKEMVCYGCATNQEDAISNAQNNCLKQFFSLFATTQNIIENKKIFEEKILKHKEKYIESQKIIEEEKKDCTSITLQTKIKTDFLYRHLKAYDFPILSVNDEVLKQFGVNTKEISLEEKKNAIESAFKNMFVSNNLKNLFNIELIDKEIVTDIENKNFFKIKINYILSLNYDKYIKWISEFEDTLLLANIKKIENIAEIYTNLNNLKLRDNSKVKTIENGFGFMTNKNDNLKLDIYNFPSEYSDLSFLKQDYVLKYDDYLNFVVILTDKEDKPITKHTIVQKSNQVLLSNLDHENLILDSFSQKANLNIIKPLFDTENNTLNLEYQFYLKKEFLDKFDKLKLEVEIKK